MTLSFAEESPSDLVAYGKVSIAFEVNSRLVPVHLEEGLGGIHLVEETVADPYTKDYDAYAGEGPCRWASRWDLSNWGILSAFDSGRRVGGAVVARKTPDVNMLEGRDDLAALWDFRIHPDYRRRKVGAALFAEAVAWARNHACREMIIETQNVNVAACRFYASRGCRLRSMDTRAYPDLPEETQMIWHFPLETGHVRTV